MDKFFIEGISLDTGMTSIDQSKVSNSFTNTYETTLSTSGFNLWKISISSIKYTKRKKYSLSQNGTISDTENQSYFPIGLAGDKGIPFPYAHRSI